MSLDNVDIILLSAGVGKRLGKIGKVKPKSLIVINNETLISRLIKILIKFKAKKISILVGYKSYLIKKELNKFKNVNFKYIEIDNYRKYGHGLTWYKYKNYWKKRKKKILLVHTDIIFDEKFIKNILRSKKDNIIGIKDKKRSKVRQSSFVVDVNSKNQINKIDYLKNSKKYAGEIIGINKISGNLMQKIFNFMSMMFKDEKNKFLSWEQIINQFIIINKPPLYALNNQVYPWININKISDLKKAIKQFRGK